MVPDTLAPPASAGRPGPAADPRGVPVERMSWEPVANGSVIRLSPRQLRRGTRKEQQ